MEALGVATGQGSAGVRIHGGSLREGPSSRTPTASVPTSSPRPEEEIYAQSVHLFLAAIAQGMPASAAMKGFGTLGRGSFSHDDKCVFPENAALGLTADRIGHLSAARQLVVSSYEGEGDTTIFLLSSAVAAIASDRALCAPWADRSRRGEGGLEALPDFILPWTKPIWNKACSLHSLTATRCSESQARVPRRARPGPAQTETES
jgi:hypothetical protein